MCSLRIQTTLPKGRFYYSCFLSIFAICTFSLLFAPLSFHTLVTNLAAPTSASRLYALALSDLHSRLVVDSRRAHSLLDLSRHGKEGLLDIGSVFGGCFEEWDA